MNRNLTLNPLEFSQEVNKQYLRYQLTSARLTDEILSDQFEEKLWRNDSPLFKGPYVSLSRAYKEGSSVADLVGTDALHNKMRGIVPYDHLYEHQEEALHAIQDGRDTLITTGTGSGKTEAFLYPIIDRCLHLNEDPASEDGVTAVIVYPMNALAADQLDRLRELLVGSGVTFGRYVGPTPEDESQLDFEGRKVPEGTTREEYQQLRSEVDDDENVVHLPPEERYTREQIREDPPQILLVNKAILEFQLTRGKDLDLFLDAPLEYIVMDEAHTNTGAQGAEVALLLRRLKALANPPKGYISNIATSATIVDESHEGEANRFMARLFGIDQSNVSIVQEAFEGIDWPEDRYQTTAPPRPEELFERGLQAIGLENESLRATRLETIYEELTGRSLPPGDSIEEQLFEGLLQNEFANRIHRFGKKVRSLEELLEVVWEGSERGVLSTQSEAREELLTYLVLGAAAEKEDTPLFRPKLHYFVKGLEGAVAVLDRGDDSRPAKPDLFLNADDAKERYEGRREGTAFFPVVVCPQCGQHHYEQYLEEVTSEPGEELKGGHQTKAGSVFFPDETDTQSRILFTDKIVHADDEWGPGETSKHSEAFLCYACGAVHLGEQEACEHCERNGTLVEVLVLESVDQVSSCPVCRYNQGQATNYYDDPFRALREVTVANVYVLAQDMLNQADEEGKRLIVFTDNRQEAAFQAGWMQDRARRYRFRRLLHQYLPEMPDESDNGPPEISLETVVDRLADDLMDDKGRAKLIAPEVFEETLESAYDSKLRRALRRYLTVQVLREVTTSYNTRASLEAWGKLRVHYAGIDEDRDTIRTLADEFGLETDTLIQWLRGLLDGARKRQMLHHPREPIFSKTWDRRLDLVRNQYLPPIDFYPSGMRLERASDEASSQYIKVWLGKSLTGIEDWARRLDLDESQRESFLRSVWELLTDELGLLTRLDSLQWAGGDSIKGTQNVWQVDAGKIGISKQDDRYRCSFCGRIHPRATPRGGCTRWRCTDGIVEEMEDREPRDYDLVELEEADTFVMAEEHTAQVPDNHRDRIEREFKEGRDVNCLVATPTLELGVDIGALDMVLLRNVPPRSANYWQRAGRAGRRNRMAIIYTYARSNPHDLHFFRDPEAILDGAVRPPNFNLQNPVMIRKHVHAAVLTQLHAELLDEEDKWIDNVIPNRIGEVVFDEGEPRTDLGPIVNPLREALSDEDRKLRLLAGLEKSFSANWPDDPEYVAPETLETYIDEMADELEGTYRRVLDRLTWAWEQRRRLAKKEYEGETLTDEERRFKDRCESTINTLRPSPPDDDQDRGYRTYTLSVLSQEGFLPGYATSRESVVASAERAYSRGWDKFEFDINRPNPIAIHEHLPGNRIYANGGKYQVSYYKFPASEEIRNPREWAVDTERYAVKNLTEADAGYNDPSATEISSLPLVDSQLRFISHVEELENTRFRMPSVTVGVLRKRHDGGRRYEFGERAVDHRENQFVTILNFGPEQEEKDRPLGYPICVVCGGVRSPYDSEERIEDFVDYHEEHCGEAPNYYALHVHSDVDGLLFDDLEDEISAVSLGEALTLIGSHLFDMERDDLRWIPIPAEDDQFRLFLYDPMPGGSGLLEQFLDEWAAVHDAAGNLLGSCPGACSTSCYDCLRTYYNQFYHEELDRNRALEIVQELGPQPEASNPIEAINEVEEETEEDTNVWEKRLQDIVQNEWGYTNFESQGRVELPDINSYTLPDLYHEDAQIAIYLDGPVHSEQGQKQKDKYLRNALKAKGWTVIDIHIEDFDNDQMMGVYRQQIGNEIAA